MSKLDQLKALGDAKRVARKGGVSVDSVQQAREQAACRESGSTPLPSTKLKRGRPKIVGKRPWDIGCISRRTRYRRQAKQRENSK